MSFSRILGKEKLDIPGLCRCVGCEGVRHLALALPLERGGYLARGKVLSDRHSTLSQVLIMHHLQRCFSPTGMDMLPQVARRAPVAFVQEPVDQAVAALRVRAFEHMRAAAPDVRERRLRFEEGVNGGRPCGGLIIWNAGKSLLCVVRIFLGLPKANCSAAGSSGSGSAAGGATESSSLDSESLISIGVGAVFFGRLVGLGRGGASLSDESERLA